jgi:acyl-CoA synthetase (NDP forming)
MTNLDQLFNPRAVAIIGVSDKPYGGGFFLKNLKTMKFDRPIYIFNPRLRGQCIEDLEVHGSILELENHEPIDYAIIAVPAEKCPEILDQIGQKRIPFATIFTSGFSEVGRKDLEEKLLIIAQKHNLRILGPNCLGVFVPKSKLSISWRLSPQSGEFSMILQSGGLAVQLSSMASTIYGNPPSKVISIGNQIDLNVNDFLDYFLTDPETKLVGLYLENLKNKEDGKLFINHVKTLTQNKKPVIIWKVGNGLSTMDAIRSHTGGLAGSTKIWTSVARQTGAAIVNSAEELMNSAMAFHFFNGLKVNEKVGIIAVGGGASIQLCDILERNGLILPKFSPSTREKLRTLLPDVNTIIRNPLDLGSSGIDPAVFNRCLMTLDEDPNISLIIFAWIVNFDENSLNLIKKSRESMKKPLACLTYKIEDTPASCDARLRFKNGLFEVGIPTFESIEQLAISIQKLCAYNLFLAKKGIINHEIMT